MTSPSDCEVVTALRSGDEAVFLALVERHHASMVRLARGYVPSDAVAEEVAQEAWMAMLAGLPRFEGRASLASWLFSIVVNRARTRSQRERRFVPLSSLATGEGEEATVDPDRFFGEGHRWAGHWSAPPERWADDRLLAGETLDVVRRAIDALPEGQREVITLRDIEELSAAEVCAALGLTEANQRVLLHRARARVRRAVEEHMNGTERAT
ncbi:RNA polymerase sigma factor [Sorangium sp. So ce131]|uniref:RNA polymerase sigma factor n=1 Tax=Sorangium sp. So ce131 TaxID=3133282 RepID=UPI003F5DB7B9